MNDIDNIRIENQIANNLIDNIKTKNLIDRDINSLDRIIKIYFSKKRRKSEEKQVIEFLFKCLDKHGKKASVLFANLPKFNEKEKVIKRLHENYKQKFDSFYISSPNIFDASYDIVKSNDKTKIINYILIISFLFLFIFNNSYRIYNYNQIELLNKNLTKKCNRFEQTNKNLTIKCDQFEQINKNLTIKCNRFEQANKNLIKKYDKIQKSNDELTTKCNHQEQIIKDFEIKNIIKTNESKKDDDKSYIKTSSSTSIAAYEFSGSLTLKFVEIAPTVTYIGDYAFYNCTYLEKIIIPPSVTYIGKGAFKDCKRLESFVIPPSVTIIKEHLFNGCVSLKNVDIPSTIKAIEDDAFFNCASLGPIRISSNVIQMGSQNWINPNATLIFG